MNDNNDEQKYFINRNIFKDGVASDDGEFSRTGKALWIFIPFIIGLLIVAIVIALTQSFIMGIPALICVAIAYVFILRKMVFDENQFKRLVANNEANQEFGIANINNILNISEDNQIFWQVNKKGLGSSYLITFDYASITDETDHANQNAITEAFIPFIQQLHENHFDFNFYDIAIQNKISAGTLNLQKRARKLPKDSWLQLISMLKNNTIASLEQDGSAKYRMFFEIINSDERNVANFKGILEDIIKTTLATQHSIVNPHILDFDELMNFFINYYQIDSFDYSQRNVDNISVAKYFKFISFFDIYGQEYSIDAFDPQFDTTHQNKSISVEREGEMAINTEIKHNQNKEHNDNNIEQTNKQRQIKEQEKIDSAMNGKHHMVRPGSRYDTIAQKQKREEQTRQHQEEIKQKQIQQSKKNMQKNQASAISLSDLLNAQSNRDNK